MCAWIELHQSVVTHRKTLALADALDVDPVLALGHMASLWLWALDNSPDGVLGEVSDRTLARAAQWRGDPAAFRAALVEAGLIDEDQAIHDWHGYAGKLLDRREANAEKQRQWRNRQHFAIDEHRDGNVTVTRNQSERLRTAATVPNPTVPTVKESLTTAVEGGPAPEAVASAPPVDAVPVTSLQRTVTVYEPPTDAPVPISKPTRGNVRVAAVIDALRAEGMTGVLTGRDKKALKETECIPVQVAALYAAIFRGEYGDPFMHDNLSVCLCLEKLPGWLSHLAGHQPPAKQNGGPPKSASGRMRALIERTANGQPRSSLDAGGWGDPGPSLPEVRRRLPSQLP